MKAIFIGTVSAAFWFAGSHTWMQPTPATGNLPVIACMPAADSMQLSGKWFLQPVLPSDTAAGKVPYIGFDTKQHRFSGHTGCNNMSGKFTLSGKTLRFDSNMITTKMACTGYNEAAFIKSLLRTNGYKFDGNILVLLFDGTELSRWSRNLPRPRVNRA